MSQESAYTGNGGCSVCDITQPDMLRLWHCVFKDPMHYRGADGTEVKLVAPSTNKKVGAARNKPSISLIPAAATIHEVHAFMDGKKKYGQYN